ncbi:hypothetical protein [Dactylosporangium salmoneum]|uniref:Uncharacterized protein n=1 Tax=Dactylosporangium salmoneum TaxID=53361 RepID=A0ABN3G930_9ACTN
MSHARRLRRCRAHERYWIKTGHWGEAAGSAKAHVCDDQGYGLAVMRRRMPDPGWAWQRRTWWLYPARTFTDDAGGAP